MKLLYKVHLKTKQHWYNTDFAVIDTAADLPAIKDMRQYCRAFLMELGGRYPAKMNSAGYIALPFPLNVQIVGDNDRETLLHEFPKDAGQAAVVRLPDGWTLPAGCNETPCEIRQMHVWSDGMYLRAWDTGGFGFVEVNLGNLWLDNPDQIPAATHHEFNPQ